MQKGKERKSTRIGIENAVIILFCALAALLDFVDISYVDDAFRNRMISKIVQQTCGSVAGVLLLLRLKVKLFQKPQQLLYLIPCMIVAIDNFQFSSCFNGKMELVRTGALDFSLFFAYCMLIGLFEELVFRGVLFSLLAGFFSQDHKGFLKTYIVSSVLFGAAHFFNGFSLGVLLQVGYTVLTGGLFAFCLIKTKNILCCAAVHGVYNFCGLLFDEQGLGSGVVFDVGTTVTMLIVGVSVGIFVLYKVWKYPEEERKELYIRLGISEKESID